MEYYNGVNVLNADCPISFSLGNRSAGKSFYWKRYCIKKHLETGEQFIYLRRYQIDIDVCMDTFFDDISNVFPGWLFEKIGNRLYLYKENEAGEKYDVRCCGYTFPMSAVYKLKSIPFEQIKTIFFDEFIPENLQYLKPLEPTYEPNMLLSLYMTVARGYKKVIREDVKIICVANAVTLFNPYFSFFGIDLVSKKKVKKNGVYAELIENKSVVEEIRKTKIGKLLEQTNYGNYALGNQSYHDIYSDINKHGKRDKAFCELFFNDEWYIAYVDFTKDIITFAKGYDKTLKQKYKLQDFETDDVVPYFTGDIVKFFRKMASENKIRYESMEIKSVLSGFIIPNIKR